MKRWRATIASAFVLASAASASPQDGYGDPLPEGAIARIGTVRLRHDRAVSAIAFLPDGGGVMSASGDGTIRIWNLSDGKERLRYAGHGTAMALSASGKIAASGGMDRTIRLWETGTGLEIVRFKAPERVLAIVMPADAGIVASRQYNDRLVRIWNIDTGEELRALEGHATPVKDMAISPDGRSLASTDSDGVLRIWNVDTGETEAVVDKNDGGAAFVAFSPDGTTLAVSCLDGSIRLRDARTGKGQAGFKATAPGPLTYSPDGTVLLHRTQAAILLWDVESGRERGRIDTGAENMALCAAFSSDGSLLAWGGVVGAVHLHDANTCEPRPVTDAPEGFVAPFAFLPDGDTLVAWSLEGSMGFWEMRTGKRLRRFPTASKWVGDVEILPDGETLVTSDGRIVFWDIKSGKAIGRIDSPAFDVAVSPDGKSAALAEFGSVEIFDVEWGTRGRRIEGHTHAGFFARY